jgi:hypothetical protein
LSGSVVILLTWWVGWGPDEHRPKPPPIRQGHELDILRRPEARAGIRSRRTGLVHVPEPGVSG